MRKLNLALTAATALVLMGGCSKKQLQNEQGGGSPNLANMNTQSSFLSPPGDVVGKVTVGYQGWFSCTGDGGGLNWSHTNFETWPDVRQYTTTFGSVPFFQNGAQQPAFTGTLGNGSPAQTFSSYSQQVSNTHCLWMQQNGIDCFALQRFGSYVSNTGLLNFYNGVANHMMTAAQTYGRKFYMMYDCGVADSTKIKNDWTNVIVGGQHFTSSSAYARQNGKPVVCFFGVGKADRGPAAGWVSLINWFKAQGCYVIGSSPYNAPSDAVNLSAYTACNMLLPWVVGLRANRDYNQYYAYLKTFCDANNIDLQADVFPGGAFNNTNAATPKNDIPRTHGDFMWQQFVGVKNAGVSSVYISMFDEYNEGTAIANSAESAPWIPSGKYFLTLDADGTPVTSDFYLRLAADGGKMIKGQTSLSTTHPTPHILTPPASLTPHVLSSTSIQVNWSAVTNSPCYNLKRSTVNGGPYTTVAAGVTSPTYTNTGLAPNTTYYYVVTSGRINGSESVISRQVNAKTNP